MKSATRGRMASSAIRRPAMVYGDTIRLAPACRSLASAPGALARATMNSCGLIARAESVTYTLLASESIVVISPRARSMPAARSVASSVASPMTTRCPSAAARSSEGALMSMTTNRWPVWTSSRITVDPTRPYPQTM